MNRTVRLLRLVLPGRNPLARGADRLQGGLLIAVIALGLLLVPIMLTVGSVTYVGLAEKGEQQARTWHQTVAVLTEDAPAVGADGPGVPAATSSRVMAEWRLPNGATYTGRVPAVTGSRAGTKVTVWLDEQGKPVDSPVETSDAVAAGVLVAVTGWFVATGLLTLVYYRVSRLLDRRRLRSWEQEWTRVEPEWRNQLR